MLALRLTILKEGQDVLQKLDFTHTKHDAESHSKAESRFLLFRCDAALNKSKDNIEAHCERQPPVKFELLYNLVELKFTPVSCVFIPAISLLKAVESLLRLLKKFEVCVWIMFWIQALLAKFECSLDLILCGRPGFQLKKFVEILFLP